MISHQFFLLTLPWPSHFYSSPLLFSSFLWEGHLFSFFSLGIFLKLIFLYLLSCFSAFLLPRFSAFLLVCFLASLLLCFSVSSLFRFSTSLLFCFLAFLLLCFSAFLLPHVFAFQISDGRMAEGKAEENLNKSYISEIARWKARAGKFE